VMLALEKKTLISLPDLWEHNPDPRHNSYIAAMPLKNINEDIFAILLITGMPFISMNKKTVRSISLICSWAAFIIEARREEPAQFRRAGENGRFRIYEPSFFKEYISITHRTYRHFNLISNIAVFTSTKEGVFTQAKLEQLLLATTRNGDVPGEIDTHIPCVCILLPLTGERGATLFLERILKHAKEAEPNGEFITGCLIPFNECKNHEEIWTRCQKFVTDAHQS